MRSIRIALVLLAALTLSCASARELARRSAVALQGGDTDKAYDWARRALDKDPGNRDARAAMHEAVQMIAGDWKARVRNLAEVDTVAAAKQTLEFATFRAEAARYRAPVDPDSAYMGEERALRSAAGRIWFAEGVTSLEQERPKRAYDQFLEASLYDPRRPGLDDSIRVSFDRAVTRVAVLPLENQTSRMGLTRELTQSWWDQLAQGLRGREFRFTRLLSLEDAAREAGSTRDLDRRAAIRLGRRLGAGQVVWGRVYGLDSETRTARISDVVYRKVVERDTSGGRLTTWIPVPFEALLRERDVTVSLEYELISTADGRMLAGDRVTRDLHARTAYTTFAGDGRPDEYCWAPPRDAPGFRGDLEHARGAERRWKEAGPGGSMELPAFLERARKERGRREYHREYLPSFYPGASPWVYLDDLPPAGDLAFAALVNDWRPILETLRRIEPLDEPDVERD